MTGGCTTTIEKVYYFLSKVHYHDIILFSYNQQYTSAHLMLNYTSKILQNFTEDTRQSPYYSGPDFQPDSTNHTVRPIAELLRIICFVPIIFPPWEGHSSSLAATTRLQLAPGLLEAAALVGRGRLLEGSFLDVGVLDILARITGGQGDADLGPKFGVGDRQHGHSDVAFLRRRPPSGGHIADQGLGRALVEAE